MGDIIDIAYDAIDEHESSEQRENCSNASYADGSFEQEGNYALSFNSEQHAKD